jgi:thiol-disulfide isomerase/thioredoxin
MRYRLAALLFTLLYCSAYGQNQKVELWGIEQLQDYMESGDNDSKLKVINFWATWCAPCIKELPYYEEVNTNYQNGVEVLLVSLDFADDLDNKVISLLEKKSIKSKVVLLANENYNEWIDKVDKSWTGAVPATMFITSEGKHVFYEREFEREELFSVIDKLKPKPNKP